MIAQIPPAGMMGLAPYGRDRQLLVSLPAAIRLAAREYPQLTQVMQEKFAPLAELRVRQAVAAGNENAVELAAVQFAATPAAAVAHKWLGDRALSSGWFSRASAQYERALRTASAAERPNLMARVRLAAALRGEEAGEPATQNVAFGDDTMTAEDFERMVAELRAANSAQSAAGGGASDQQRLYPAPAPSGFEHVQRARLDGPVGEDANAEITRHINQLGVNWCERQIATWLEGDTLYVTNRFQVAAYDLTSGQRLWQTTRLPGNMLRSREWSLIPMRPLLVGDTIFVRLLYGAGPLLAAIEKSSGKLLWTSEQRTNEFLISDPHLVQDQLTALTLVRGEQGQCTLRMTTLDRATGEPLVQHNLLRLNDVWWSRRACEAIALDDSLVACLGGISLSCDLDGRVHWVRRQVALPPDEETSWVRQHFERPLLVDGRLLLTQPGVRSIECIDPETGGVIWSRVVPDIESLVGSCEGRLIVQTQSAFLALSPEDGAEVWRHERPEVYDATLGGGPGGLLYVARQPHPEQKDRHVPRLVWLDPATGAIRASFVMSSLEETDSHFGPLVAHKDRLWTFWGRGQAEPNRDFLELVPRGEAAVAVAAANGTDDPWGGMVDQALRQAAAQKLPQWSLLAASAGSESGLRVEAHGEKDVLAVIARADRPIVLAQEIGAKVLRNKLHLRICHGGDASGEIAVHFDGQKIWSEQLAAEQQSKWQDREVDLASVAGRQGLLSIVVRAAANSDLTTYWQRLELSP
jgi:outer membrane protein assembly factor BamB